jgi:NAD(P)-dependent dehydrogenase (short-subunit alcohol dehydrogenase family)
MNTPVVVITGASAGVGRALSRLYAASGARIGLIARGRDELEATRREIEVLGGEAVVCVADVAHAEQVEAAAQTIEHTFGAPDIWINNAMASVFSPVKDMTADEFRRVTEVTYLGVVHGTLAALRRMLPRDRGSIVQVGSALAYRGIPLQSAYCAAKHAVQGFCDSLRAELLHDASHVTLTMVQLPALNTPQFDWVKSRLPNRAQPVPPIFQPEVAAEAIVWAAQSGRREVWVGMPTVQAILADKVRLACSIACLPAWVTTRSKPTNLKIQRARTICGRRSQAITARTAVSTRAPSRSVCRHGVLSIAESWQLSPVWQRLRLES